MSAQGEPLDHCRCRCCGCLGDRGARLLSTRRATARTGRQRLVRPCASWRSGLVTRIRQGGGSMRRQHRDNVTCIGIFREFDSRHKPIFNRNASRLVSAGSARPSRRATVISSCKDVTHAISASWPHECHPARGEGAAAWCVRCARAGAPGGPCAGRRRAAGGAARDRGDKGSITFHHLDHTDTFPVCATAQAGKATRGRLSAWHSPAGPQTGLASS